MQARTSAPQFGLRFHNVMPFLNNMNPLSRGKAFAYLMGIGSITRAFTGLTRIGVTHPAILKHFIEPPTFKTEAEAQRYKVDRMVSFFERAFVETFDVALFPAALLLGHDLFNHLYSQVLFRKALQPPQVSLEGLMTESSRLAGLFSEFSPHDQTAVVKVVNEKLADIFNFDSGRVVYNTIFNKPVFNAHAKRFLDGPRANLVYMAEAAFSDLKPMLNSFTEELRTQKLQDLLVAIARSKPLMHHQRKLNMLGAAAILPAIVFVGPIVGGQWVQKFTDTVWSRALRPKIQAYMAPKNPPVNTVINASVPTFGQRRFQPVTHSQLQEGASTWA